MNDEALPLKDEENYKKFEELNKKLEESRRAEAQRQIDELIEMVRSVERYYFFQANEKHDAASKKLAELRDKLIAKLAV